MKKSSILPTLIAIVIILVLIIVALGFVYFSKQISDSKFFAGKTAAEITSISSSQTSSGEIAPVTEVKFSRNEGDLITFDYPEDGTVAIESYLPKDKFTSKEDIKNITVKNNLVEIYLSKTKIDAKQNTYMTDKVMYANDGSTCTISYASVSSDATKLSFPCSKAIYKTEIGSANTPGFGYILDKKLIYLAIPTSSVAKSTATTSTVSGSVATSSQSVTSAEIQTTGETGGSFFTSFGANGNMREIINIDNSQFDAKYKTGLILANMPASWKNLYLELRCNDVSKPENASACIQSFARFINTLEFK